MQWVSLGVGSKGPSLAPADEIVCVCVCVQCGVCACACVCVCACACIEGVCFAQSLESIVTAC